MLERQEFLDLVFRLTGVFSSVTSVRFGQNYSFRGQARNFSQRRGLENTKLYNDNLLVPPPSQDSKRYEFPDIPGRLGQNSTSHIHKLARLSPGLLSKPFCLAGELSAFRSSTCISQTL